MSRRFVYYGASSAGVNFLLDDYPASGSQCYFHKVSSTYNGDCIQVRRSSDSAILDIGFVNDVLDTTALINFIGNNTGYVTIWYDQSGNNIDITQVDPNKQPAIIINGVLQTLNNLPALKFDGVNDFMTTGTQENIIQDNFYVACIGEILTSNISLFAKAIATNATNRYFIVREAVTYGIINTDPPKLDYNQSSVAKLYGLGSFLESGQYFFKKSFENNINLDTENGQNVSDVGFRFLIGAYPSNSTNEVFHNDGKIQSFGYWGGQNYLDDVSIINNKINEYYQVY